jgi:hypothetical protein
METAEAFVPHPQVLLTELGDGTGVLLHLETKFYYTLNAAGVLVWKSLGDPRCRTAPALADRMAEAFEVAPDVAVLDIHQLIRELTDEGLVSPAAQW